MASGTPVVRVHGTSASISDLVESGRQVAGAPRVERGALDAQQRQLAGVQQRMLEADLVAGDLPVGDGRLAHHVVGDRAGELIAVGFQVERSTRVRRERRRRAESRKQYDKPRETDRCASRWCSSRAPEEKSDDKKKE